MRIDGKIIAGNILTKLTGTVSTLKRGGITPALAVILVGNDPASVSYIRQKQKAADSIGAKLILEQFKDSVTPVMLESAIAHYNNDSAVHGLIIQRPVPKFIGKRGDILSSVAPAKDVDGFIPDSPFEVPVARAVITILEEIHTKLTDAELTRFSFKQWLNSQSMAIIGRGDTAGAPIASTLSKYDCTTSIIHSKTSNPEKILRNATVIISCTGKRGIATKSTVSQGVILISVGLWRDTEGKLHGDYEEEDIKDTASFYTPTPGGVGPVNVACLMQNLVEACMISIK
jgi:methylenetetrahydrofolate dehydrogenase (NADP+)/methenyltetrahydrofolate cyclohydrolase